jgi:hypothetical protein
MFKVTGNWRKIYFPIAIFLKMSCISLSHLEKTDAYVSGNLGLMDASLMRKE